MKIYSPSEYVGAEATPGIVITTEDGTRVGFFPAEGTHIDAIFHENFGVPLTDGETNVVAPFINRYPYTNKTVLVLHNDAMDHMEIELQAVSNQPTWNLGTQEALETAMKEILQ